MSALGCLGIALCAILGVRVGGWLLVELARALHQGFHEGVEADAAEQTSVVGFQHPQDPDDDDDDAADP